MTHFAGKAVKVALISGLSVFLLGATALAAEGEIAIGAGCTTGSSLRMRAEASTDSSIVTTLDKSVAVAILDDSIDGWYKISYNGNTGYVSGDYLTVDQDNIFTTYGRVNASGVNVRSDPSTESSSLATVDEGTIVTVNALVDGWYDVTCEYGTEGYIRSDFLDLTESASDNSDIVATAKQYLGVRYVYGGASPSGFDCSGFTMYIYKQYGYSLPHTATGQWQSGLGTRIWGISALQPGDLVFFNDPARNAGKACSHAGIYIGNGQFIHSSSSSSGGVIISDLTSGYYNTYFVGGIHV
ncbi:C40 family peptidase [Dysosmobacter sp.]|uniref:C40 family peptidase n=1 Tax=Dysosmobacter sp. TaxID=2591382 RepID=UPI001BB484C5|nr:SH3 domain-containing protein [Dysosmobacter sp.]MCI6053863.1 SH3 domain-containing protein [Dysosmobacter sp.]MDY5511161.1 SH3 domain-containing protein [Dysosmobacter sp.]QUO38216.1 C40 family peptidase [Dysosmobacter sp. Marseille-Q4140]